ncbi:DUF998 domain-containing protein [Flavobacterium sp. LC2016-23]|nr:DUF998 domain-containing protein [Flavobacterium sp. LC2016-23]
MNIMRAVQLNLIQITALICIIACIADVIVLFLAGSYYPGYSQLKNTMSSLGETISPVSELISIWWICIGIIFIFFGIIFRKAFGSHLNSVKTASFLILFYGLGEGIGSGLFKADRIGGKMPHSFVIHDIAGGIGSIAALLLPLVMLRVIPKISNPHFYLFSWIVFAFGFSTMLLFTIRFSHDQDNLIALYKGFWQRLFMLNLYVYFITISIIMYCKKV